MEGIGKILAGLVAGVVAGFVLGGTGPRRDVAKLRRENEQLGDQLLEARKKSGRQTVQFLPLPASDGTPRPVASVAPTPENPDASPTETPERFQADIEQFRVAIDAQKLRIRQGRQVLKEKTEINAKDEQKLDEIFDKMNQDLAKHADALAEAVFSGEDAAPMEMLSVSHEVTGILLEAQTAYEQVLGPSADNLDENTGAVWNFVDLSYFQSQFENAAANNPP
jgi:hypothetical protein